jgi:hypothetical protein
LRYTSRQPCFFRKSNGTNKCQAQPAIAVALSAAAEHEPIGSKDRVANEKQYGN